MTDEIVGGVPDLQSMSVGIATVFMQHTSASLTLNENASPDVRRDFAAWFDRAVPDGADYFSHTLEGPDDARPHQASLTGCSLALPVRAGASPSAPGRASTCASTATRRLAQAGGHGRRREPRRGRRLGPLGLVLALERLVILQRLGRVHVPERRVPGDELLAASTPKCFASTAPMT